MRFESTFTLARLARIGVAAFALAFLAGAAAGAAPGKAVDIRKFAFAPQDITVAPGTTITWTNADETPHTLAARDATFKSKALDTGDSFTFTFAQEGDFAYFCTLHPFMTGVVHVRTDAKAGAGSAP